MGVYLINVHLTGVYLIAVHLIGVYLMDVFLMGVYLTGMHLMGVYFIAAYPSNGGNAELLSSLPLGIADDLCTQYLSRQKQADDTLEAGTHILTEITAGISRP